MLFYTSAKSRDKDFECWLSSIMGLTLPDGLPGTLQNSCSVSDRLGEQSVNQAGVGAAAKFRELLPVFNSS